MKYLLLFFLSIPLSGLSQSFEDKIKRVSNEKLIEYKNAYEKDIQSSNTSGVILAAIAVPSVIGGGILAASDFEGQVTKFLPLGLGVILGAVSISCFSGGMKSAKKKELIEVEILNRSSAKLTISPGRVAIRF